jgi:hypothetical protein
VAIPLSSEEQHRVVHEGYSHGSHFVRWVFVLVSSVCGFYVDNETTRTIQ